MKKAIVVAYDKNRGIGENGDLPWGRSLPADLAHFKEITTGGNIIMGRKTYESIGSRPLLNRKNIVLSSSSVMGAVGVKNLAEALAQANQGGQDNQNIYIIGGERVFSEALPFVDTIYATEVKHAFSGADVFFPEISANLWQEISRVNHPADDKNKYEFDFVEYQRKL